MASTTEVWEQQTSTVEDWTVAFTGTAAVGSADGLATVLGVGAFSAASLAVGLAAGSATALGVGRSTARAVGDADGKATVQGVGFATGVSSAVGLAQGVATVSAVGSESNDGVGLSAGAATVSGVGESTADAVGDADGAAIVAGTGASIASAAGASSGVATAAASGADGSATIILEAFTGPVFETDASDRILTLTYPAGIEANDVLLVPLVSDWADGWANSDGFTFLQNNDSNPTHAVRLQVFGKIAAGPLTGTTDFTFNSSAVSVMGGAMLRLSGVDVSGGLAAIQDATAVDNKSASAPDTSPIGSSITTVTDGAMVLYVEANDGSVNSGSGAPATAVYDADTTLGNDIGMALSYKVQATAGASGIATFTLESAEDWVVTTLALRPVGPSGGAGAASGVATAAAVGENGSAIPAVVYDGVQAYLKHTGGPTGAADGAALSFAWAGTFNSDGSAMTLLDIPGTVPVKLTRNADNTITFAGGTAGAVFSNSTAAVAASVGFCIVLASANGTASHLHVIHATGIISGTNTPGSATNLDLTADWFFGSDGGAAEFLDADTALWWADDSFIDFSVADNREQFWDTTNDLLRDPGSDGSNPTDGTQPLVCHRNAATTHTTNVGSGGDADTAGTFTNGTSPGTYADDFSPVTLSLALVDSAENDSDNTNGSTFTAQSFGAADANRVLYVVACARAGVSVPGNDAAVTLDGDAMTLIGGAFHQVGSSARRVAIYSLAQSAMTNPTATSGDIVVTYPDAQHRGKAIFVYRGVGYSASASATANDVDGSDPLSTSLTAVTNGMILAGACIDNNSAITWTAPLAQDAAFDVLFNGNKCSGASADGLTAGAVTVTADPATAPSIGALFAATFDPA